MKFKTQRIVATILTLCMFLALLPTATFANTNSFDESEIWLEEEQLEAIVDEITQTDVTSIASNEAPEGYVPQNTLMQKAVRLFAEESSKKVLLVEDVLPWSSTANQVVLGSLTQYQKVTTSQFLSVDLSEYGVIVFANDQPFATYENYSMFKEYMELFASIGGVIVFGACDAGWSNGSLIEKLPGDVTKQTHYVVKNHIADYNHPIVTGSLSDNTALLDGDLTGSYCSHVSFDEESLPVGSKVILREDDTNRPTLVEYPLGKGRVIASGLTWEFTYDRAGKSGSYGPIGYFAQKAMDDMFRYAIRVSSIDVNDLNALKQYYMNKNGHYIVVGDKQAPNNPPIENATVSVGTKKYTTDANGMVTYTDAFGVNTVTVTAEGYRTNKQYYDLKQRTSRMIFMEPIKNDGRPYISMVADTKLYYDLRTQTRQFTEGDSTMLNLKVDGVWGSHLGGKYIIYQDSVAGGAAGKSISSSTGYFAFAPGKSLNPGVPVKLKMVSNGGIESEPIVINLAINKKNNVSNQFNNAYNISKISKLKLGGDSNASAPNDDFKKLFPIDLSVEGAEVPVEISISEDADGYTIKGVVGFASGEYTKGLLNGKSEDNKKEWSNLKKDIQNAKERLGDRSKLFNDRKDKLAKTPWKSSVSFNVQVCGFLEVKLDKNGKIVNGSGGIIVDGGAEFNIGKTFAAGPVPVYFELKIGAGAKFQGDFTFYTADEGLGFKLGGSIKITLPSISAGGGVGVRGVATVGLEGGAELEMEIVPNWAGAIEAYGAVSIKVLFVIDFKWKFAKGNWQLWPNANKARAFSLFGNEYEYLQPELLITSRDYNQKTTMWNNGRNAKLFRIVDEVDIISLQDWIMPNSMPQISKVEDKMVMLFHADDSTRATGDNIVLMYSVCENNVWSEPEPVWASDTADMFFNHIVVNDELYVVWQKQKSKVTKVTAEDLLAEVAENSEICYAKWNKDNNSFEQQQFVTDNAVLDMYPTLAVKDDEVSVVWVSNSESDPLGTSGEYSVMKSSLISENFDTPAKLYETKDYISDIAAGYVNNKLAVIASVGFDSETAEVIYIDDDGTKNLSDSVSASALKFNNERFYWQLEGAIYEYDSTDNSTTRITAGDAKVISSSYKLVKNKDKSAIVWIDVTNGIYSVKASVLSGNSSSAPITLLTLDDSIIQYMDVCLLDSGNWQVIMNNLKKDSDMYSLVFANINTKTDIALESVYADEHNKSGDSLPINYSVTNLGENTVERVNVKIYAGDNVYTDKFVDCKIEPGATVEFTENIDTSNVDSVTDVTVFVESEDESDLTNNSEIIKIGLVDVSVSLSQYQIDENTIIVNAHIKNESKTPANVAISVVEDSLDGIVLDVKNLGALDDEQDYVYVYTIDATQIDFGEEGRKSYFFNINTLEPNLNGDTTDLIIVYPAVEENIGTAEIEEIAIEPVTGLSLDRRNVELTISGETYETAQLSASIAPQDATYKDVMWEVENADIAYVDSEGKVTARSVGQTKVIATSYDGEFVDEAIVTVYDGDTKYQLTINAGTGGSIITGATGEYFAGQSINISAQANSGYKFKNWTSSDGGSFEDENSETTTFAMPSNATTITANFESTGNGDSGSGGSGSGGSGSSGSSGRGSTGSNTTTCIVTFETNGGSKVDSQRISQNGKATQPTAPKKDGFTFAGWYLDKELTKEYDFDAGVKSDITIYAKWTEDTVMPTPPIEWVNPFEDVKTSDWFYSDVEYVVQNGLFSGTSATTFEPNNRMTRAMLVTVLWRLEGSPVLGNNPFEDVPSGQWYSEAVAWAAQNGIVSGMGDGLFAPNSDITREQMATILYRYEQFSGKIPPDIVADREFSDWDDISDYAKNPVNVLTAQGIINGKPGNLFDPKGTATRAEVAAMLHRFLEVVK
ncbi:hypothetical protein A7W90_01315 [Clostridium sp. Bc-iso-3]|nr:hypothetical protein A7W90_01315 [Clostridium sp. Bc-iso-3]